MTPNQERLTVWVPFDATESVTITDSGDTFSPSTDKRQWLSSISSLNSPSTEESFEFVYSEQAQLQSPRASPQKRLVPYLHRTCSEPEELFLSACSKGLPMLMCIFCSKSSHNCNCPEDKGSKTYFVTAKGVKGICGVFKPRDEEVSCPLMQRYGIKEGSCWLRECAASLLSERIPCTLPVEFWQPDAPKIGSLQHFVNKESELYPDIVQNFGRFVYRKIKVREVHQIGVLDIRILNGDRNSQNLLLREDFTLIPIDHGLAFPETLSLTSDRWVWLEWEQSRKPFDPVTVKDINDIDIERDIEMVSRETNLSPRALQWMRIAHLVLKKGANQGLTLYEIGKVIVRDKKKANPLRDEKPSTLEVMVTKAQECAEDDDDEKRDFMFFLGALLDDEYKRIIASSTEITVKQRTRWLKLAATRKDCEFASPQRVNSWQSDEIAWWLKGIGAEMYANNFALERISGQQLINDISTAVLPNGDVDLRCCRTSLNIRPRHCGKIMREIKLLKQKSEKKAV